jgi:O-antigen/teichoic acid export membrane protein
MSAARTVAKNTTVLILSNVLAYVFTFLTTVYSARYLGVEGWGILSIALAVTGIFGFLTDLGLSSLTVREVARDKSLANKYFANTTAMRIFLGLITFGVIAFVSYLSGYSQEITYVIYIMAISTILGSFTGVFYSIFQAYEKMEFQSLATIISNIIMLALTLAAIYLGVSVIGFALVYVIVGIFGFIYILFIYMKKFSLPRLEIDLEFWKSSLKEALPFAVTGIFVTIYFWLDSFLLSIMVGNDAVGIYNAAYRLIFVFLFIPTLFITALFPVMSRHFESAKDLLKLEYEKSFKYLFIVAIFIFIYGFIFANEIIMLIYGQKFSQSIVALQTLIWVIPIIFLNALFANIMNAMNKQRLVTLVVGLNALFNVILVLILIPKFSYVGAAIATVLTEGLGFVLLFYYISRYYFRVSLNHYLFKPILNGLIVAIFVYIIKTQVNWILAGILGLFIYIGLVYVLKIINREDIDLIKEIIPIKFLNSGDKKK